MGAPWIVSLVMVTEREIMNKPTIKRAALPGVHFSTTIIGVFFSFGIILAFRTIGMQFYALKCEEITRSAVIRNCAVLTCGVIAAAAIVIYYTLKNRFACAKVQVDDTGITRKILGRPAQSIAWENIGQCGILSFLYKKTPQGHIVFFSEQRIADDALDSAINGNFFSAWPQVIFVEVDFEKEAARLKSLCESHGIKLEDHRKEPRPKPF